MIDKKLHPILEEVLQDLFEIIIAENGSEVILLEWGCLEDICFDVAEKLRERDKIILNLK
jgi:hypothetical protein